jgi:hypothetical protein
MTGGKLKPIAVVLLFIAGLLSLVSRFAVSVKVMNYSQSLPLSDKLNLLEELLVPVNKLLSAVFKALAAEFGASAGKLNYGLGGVGLVELEIVMFFLAGLVALIAAVQESKEDKRALLGLLGALLVLVGAAIDLVKMVQGFSAKELTGLSDVFGYFKIWLVGFLVIGLGLILYALPELLAPEKKNLASVAAILVLLSGLFYVVSRAIAISKLGKAESLSSSMLGGSSLAMTGLANVKLYYLPFLAALFLVLGTALELPEALKAKE